MKNEIISWLEKNGIYSPRLRMQIADNAIKIVAGRRIDEGLFLNWLNSLSLVGVINIGNYFLKCFEAEIRSGRFDKKVIPSALPSAASDPETDEEVLAEAKEWESLVCDNPDEHCGCGVRYFDRKGNLRGHFDGKGGSVFVDGRH